MITQFQWRIQDSATAQFLQEETFYKEQPDNNKQYRRATETVKTFQRHKAKH